jgi:DNA end-binding protein Ku
MKPVDPELGLVERSDLVRGYEYETSSTSSSRIPTSKRRIESNHTMNIEAFVDEDEVDVIYQDAPYYLAPDGAMAEETFVVLREAMRKSGKLAIARLVLSSRERVVTIGAARERHVRLHAAQPQRGARHGRVFRQHPGRQARRRDARTRRRS